MFILLKINCLLVSQSVCLFFLLQIKSNIEYKVSFNIILSKGLDLSTKKYKMDF